MVKRRFDFALILQKSWEALFSMSNISSFFFFCLLPALPTSPVILPDFLLRQLGHLSGFYEGEPGLGSTVTKEEKWRCDISSCHEQGIILDAGRKDNDSPPDTRSLFIIYNEVECPCSIQNTRPPLSTPTLSSSLIFHPFC